MNESDKKIIVVRDDGFTVFSSPDNPEFMTPDRFLALNVDYLQDFPDVTVKEFGVGPGSVFTFDTKAGEIFLDNASDDVLRIVRPDDIRVHRNVRYLMSYGKDPMQWVTDRCHELGLKTWIRMEMNHEYGPPAQDNYLWMTFVGNFNKCHPEFRIKRNDPDKAENEKTVHLDFKHPGVREFKLEILREAARHGIDGISLDFCVYPPFLSDPVEDAHFMTGFIRDIRNMLDEEGENQNKYIELIARVEYDCEKDGLMWQEWIDENLLDYIIPSVVYVSECWDVPNEAFVSACEGNKCKVLTCIRPFSNFIDTDQNPEDEKSDIIRKERPVLPRVHYAKALLGLKSGSAGVQIAIGTGGLTDSYKIAPTTEYRRDGWRPLYGELADVRHLESMDKEYYFNNLNVLPADLSMENPGIILPLRIADEPERIRKATLSFYSRGLSRFEKLTVTINGNPFVLTEKELHYSIYESPFLPRRGNHGLLDEPPYLVFRIDQWWEIGKNEIEIPADVFKNGKNEFVFAYSLEKGKKPINDFFRFGEISIILEIKSN